MKTPWSYSAIKTFSQCPKKYYHVKVLEDVKDSGSAATLYGTQVHEAAEEYVCGGTSLNEKFKYIKPVLDVVKNLKGDRHCEFKLAVTKDGDGFAPCSFTAADAWWRGIADCLVVNNRKAILLDYKTSKNSRYADMKQIDLMAAATFLFFPKVEKVKGGLVFLVSRELITRTYVKSEMKKYFSVFDDELVRLQNAFKTGTWNPSTSALCRFCPVIFCPHNTK